MSDDRAAPGAGQPTPPPPAGGGWGAVDPRGPGYGQPQHAPGQDPQGQHGQPQHGQPQYGQPQYGQPQDGQGQQGQPAPGPSLDKAPSPAGEPQYRQPQYGQPQYGAPQYGAPQYGQPQYGAPQYGAPGYGPAPQRAVRPEKGVIPLRPLGLGEIYDGAIRAVRAQPRVMFGFSGVIVTVAVLLGTVLQLVALPLITDALATFGDEIDPTGQLGMADTLGFSFSTLLLTPTLELARILLTGVLTVAVSRAVIGRRTTVGELWRTSWRDVLLLLGYSLVLSLVLTVVWGGAVAGAIALAAAEAAGGALAVLLIGLPLLLVATVWVGVRLTFVAPVMVLEKTGVASVARAWRLTRGSFWRVLGIVLLAQVIMYFLTQVLFVPFSIASSFLLLEGSNDWLAVAINAVGTALVYIVSTVFLAAVVALLYIDIRIRREGLDVEEAARATEAAAAEA